MKLRVRTMQALCSLGLLVLLGCTNMTASSPAVPAKLSLSRDHATIQALHRRLHTHERTIAMQHYQIEVMTSQLEALKRIDQDTREPRRPVRNLMNVAP